MIAWDMPSSRRNGTGIGGALIAQASLSGDAGRGIVRQDLIMLAIVGFAIVAAQRLPHKIPAPHAIDVPVREHVADQHGRAEIKA